MTVFNSKEQKHIILRKKTMNIKTKKRDKYAKTMMSNKMESIFIKTNLKKSFKH